ncbi:MAG: VOC family protein [Clostridia bacterium]
MNTKIFLNLPVKSLEITTKFYTKLGFEFNPEYTNEKATCMVINDMIYIMFLTEQFFTSFTKKDIPDTKNMAQCIVALSVDSRLEVDRLVDLAFEAGAGVYNETQDLGFMYSRSFSDPDGHMVEIFVMED